MGSKGNRDRTSCPLVCMRHKKSSGGTCAASSTRAGPTWLTTHKVYRPRHDWNIRLNSRNLDHIGWLDVPVAANDELSIFPQAASADLSALCDHKQASAVQDHDPMAIEGD